jgi:hypothetical protein
LKILLCTSDNCVRLLVSITETVLKSYRVFHKNEIELNNNIDTDIHVYIYMGIGICVVTVDCRYRSIQYESKLQGFG